MPHVVFAVQPHPLCCIFHTVVTAVLFLVFSVQSIVMVVDAMALVSRVSSKETV